MIDGGLSDISGTFPFPTEKNQGTERRSGAEREGATGTPAVYKPRLTSIIVIGVTSMIVTALNSLLTVPD
jgi:hypothetical protein